MKRQVDLKDISDGRLYEKNDMVKAGCGGCQGCSACCKGMGNTVVLDPMDIYRLTVDLNQTFEQLMVDKIELNVVDGIILPNLKMNNESETCAFLDKEGWCSIHPQRPGICRLFPLGRFYTDRTFKYFLQTQECPAANKTKVKISKWLDIPDLLPYEKYICDWHYFLDDTQKIIEDASDEMIKNVSLYILQMFYIRPYGQKADFYKQFYRRLEEVKKILAIRS